MENVLLNGELALSYPEDFEQMDTLELSRASFTDRAPFFSIRNPRRHISVTASWKKAGLFSPAGGVLQAARHSERKFSQAMTGRAYRGGEAEPAQLGGRSAARYRCRYTVEGVEMTGITFVAGSRRHIYYLHGYYQTAYEKDCLPLWEALVESAAWRE